MVGNGLLGDHVVGNELLGDHFVGNEFLVDHVNGNDPSSMAMTSSATTFTALMTGKTLTQNKHLQEIPDHISAIM